MLFMHLLSSIDLASLSHSISFPLSSLLIMADDPLKINALATKVKGIVLTVGGTIFLISVAVAGIMRMVAFGNERRVALSNMALTAAVVGLIIMLLSTTLDTFLRGVFGG
jgi:hypothetical protein